MFGIDLTRSDWAGLAAVVYLVVRILYSVGRVLWWYAADARRVVKAAPLSPLVTGFAVGTMAVAVVSAVTDWPPRGFPVVVYLAASIAGFVLGIILDFVIEIRTWTISTWLASFRVPQYRERLLHGDATVRLGAAERLAPLGLYAVPARPELLAVMRGDESADARAAAALAVICSVADPPPEDDPETPRAAWAALADPDPRVRTYAAALVVAFNAAPPADVVPALCAGLELTDGDGDAAGVATTSLGRLGPDAEPAVGALKAAALRRERPNSDAPAALGKIGAAAVPALVEILERGDRFCRRAAADALGDVGEPARAALPTLRAAAASPDSSLKYAAEKAIQKLGADV